MTITRRIRDPIYNLVKFSEEEDIFWELLNSYPIQRLRYIKQLGFSDFVYPGATHTRFSHSIGVLEMARRILNALEDNTPILQNEDHVFKKKATLCAALLHDLGHGPFSHVFEEIREEYGYKRSHEAFTISLIKSDEISAILGSELVSEVCRLIETEDAGIYKNIISHQIDADRLDFLQRDRHFSGIRFGAIDIEWILDSLRIFDVPYDHGEEAVRPQFVFDSKGLRSLEEYLSSYVKIYTDVYFHKTTRGVQHLFSRALKAVIANRDELRGKNLHSIVFDYFDLAERFVSQNKDYMNNEIEDSADELELLKIYIQMNDSTLVDLLDRARRIECSDPIVNVLCDRYFNRDLFKCLETEKSPEEELARFRAFEIELNKNKIDFIKDTLKAKGLKQYNEIGERFLSNILVLEKSSAHPKPIYSISNTAKSLMGFKTVKYYFPNRDEFNHASKLWHESR